MKYFNTKFFELSNELYFALDQHETIVEAAGKWKEHLGIDLKELNGINFFSLIPTNNILQVKELFNRCKNSVQSGLSCSSLYSKEKKIHPVTLELSFDSENGNFIGCIRSLAIEERLHLFPFSILDTSSSLICYLDNQLNYKYLNRSFESWLGSEKNEYLSKKFDSLNKNPLMNSLRIYMDEALSGTKQSVEMITPDLNNDNLYRIMNINIVPENSSGKVMGLYVFIDDITELRTNAIEAIDKVKKFQTLFDNLSQGVVLQDNKGRIVEFNRSALKILRLTKDQLLGKTSYDPSWKTIDENHLPFVPDHHPAMVAIKSGIAVYDKLMGVYTSDSDIAWISVTAIPLFEGNDSKPYQVLVTFEDLTKTFKLKQELKAKSSWKTALLNGADDALISTDPEGIIVTFNKKAEDLLGYKADELVGKHTPLVFHDEEEVKQKASELSAEFKETISPGIETFVARALRVGKDTTPWTYVTKSKERIQINLKVTAIRDDQNKCIGYLGSATRR